MHFLLLENQKLKRQLKNYKLKYQRLNQQYNSLLIKQQNQIYINKQSKLTIPDENQKDVISQLKNFQNYVNLQTSFQNNSSLQFIQRQHHYQKNQQQIFNKDICFNEKNSLQNIKTSIKEQKQTDKQFYLIQNCFILQKSKQLSAQDSIKFIYPDPNDKKIKQLYQMIAKYSFYGWGITQIVDDQFHSRKNQINYGTLYQQVLFVFQDNSSNDQVPLIFQKINSVKKRYVHAIIKPEHFQQSGKLFQTQVIFGFISIFPLRSIFQQILKTILQEVKILKIKNQSEVITKNQKYDKISQIMMIIKDLKIKDFPIQLNIKTGICNISIKSQGFQQIQTQNTTFLNYFLRKLNDKTISILIHGALVEKHLLITASNRSLLTQIFQIIRLGIYPFNWLFPIVYNLSKPFYPYLQSPLPILIGCLSYQFLNLPKNDLCIVQIDTCFKNNQIQKKFKVMDKYSKNINYLQKKLNKHPQSKGEVIKNYVKKLCTLLQKGVLLNQQLNQFHIDFMQTQMASYYKQKHDKNGQKMTKNN